MRKLHRQSDWYMTAFLKAVGTFVVLIVVGILFYLGKEAQFAFDQNFPYGFKVVASGKPFPADHDIETDVNATVLSANPDGLDELDEKDEGVPMPMIADIDMDPANSVGAATGAYHGESADPIDPLFLFRDNYRAQKKAEVGDKFTFYVFGTPAQTGDKIYLKYAPDNSFEPTISPYKFRLRMVKAPDGVNAPPVDIVLGRDFKGVIELPAWQAKTDEDRAKGYVFELEAIPQMSTVAATFRNMLQTKWNPTIAYPQFGIIPLVLASVMVTLLSVLIATPLSIALAVYISEVAPQATKTRLKTLIELLSSVPTVVLGYFGILIMGPLLMNALGHVFRVDSGRMLLTCAVMMGILLIPTIANLIEDTLSNLPDHFRDGADALGLTQSESIKQVILPAAKAGIIGAFLIGMARAFGETMLLWMLSGGTVTMLNARNGGEFFKYFVGPVKGVPDTVGIELGNVSFESTHYGHLFVIGLVLFFVTFGINTLRLLDRKEGTMDAIRSLSNRAEQAQIIKRNRLLLNKVRLLMLQGVSYFVAAIVLWIIGTIFFKGIGAINWTFLTDIPRENMSAGGIGPMIAGSLYLIIGTLLIVCVIGIPGGIFLAEYAGKGRVVRAIRSLVLSLAGTPSVVYGLFGFAVFVLLITKKSSLIAGWLTLSTMIIPVVVLNTETAIKAVPQSQIEAALALGMSKWGAIWKVALPQALPGIMTGLVLASGRAAGEAPPILLTAGIFYTTQQPKGLAIITEPVMNLPYHISEAVKQSGTFKEQTVWGTCLVLMAIILIVNAFALYVRASQRRKNRA